MNGWITARAAAKYAGLAPKTGFRTINHYIRIGLIPAEYVGGDHQNMVKPEGVDVAMRKLRTNRLKRLGIKIEEAA